MNSVMLSVLCVTLSCFEDGDCWTAQIHFQGYAVTITAGHTDCRIAVNLCAIRTRSRYRSPIGDRPLRIFIAGRRS